MKGIDACISAVWGRRITGYAEFASCYRAEILRRTAVNQCSSIAIESNLDFGDFEGRVAPKPVRYVMQRKACANTVVDKIEVGAPSRVG